MTEPTTTTDLPALRDILDEYRTCEFATMSRTGLPIAWPVVVDVPPAADRMVLTTSIAFPQKAFNVRRDPRVALLFSDPTGTGRTDLPHVLVRGTARCPARIETGTAGLEQYWRKLAIRQPASKSYGRTVVGRRLFDWYYMRLVITVTPREITTGRPSSDTHPMSAPRVSRADRSVFAQLGRELPYFDNAVLGTATDGEPPVLRRVRLAAEPGSATFRVAGPTAGLVAGPASVLLHRHDDALWHQRQAGATGELGQTGGQWWFRPDRLLPNQFPSNPLDMMRIIGQARRAASRYLERRGLQRPTIDWAAHRSSATD
jgi:hypothetical protein